MDLLSLNPFSKRKKHSKLEIQFAGANFSCPLKIIQRPHQKRLNLSVKPDGSILVTCSKGVSKKDIFSFVQKNEKWIEVQLEHFKKFKTRFPLKQYKTGEEWMFLGRNYPLRYIDQGARIKVYIQNFELIIEGLGGHRMEIEQKQKKIFYFYKKAAQELIGQRAVELSKKYQLHYSKLNFKTLSARWGSCSSHGVVTINWKLIGAPPKVIDYVLTHELCHLIHQNHSRAFWDLVAEKMPDFKTHKQWLKENSYSFDFLNKKSELAES